MHKTVITTVIHNLKSSAIKPSIASIYHNHLSQHQFATINHIHQLETQSFAIINPIHQLQSLITTTNNRITTILTNQLKPSIKSINYDDQLSEKYLDRKTHMVYWLSVSGGGTNGCHPLLWWYIL